MKNPLAEQFHDLVPIAAGPNVVGLVGVEDQAEVGEVLVQDRGRKLVGFLAVCGNKLVRQLAVTVSISAAVMADIFVGPFVGDSDLWVQLGEPSNHREGRGPGCVE